MEWCYEYCRQIWSWIRFNVSGALPDTPKTLWCTGKNGEKEDFKYHSAKGLVHHVWKGVASCMQFQTNVIGQKYLSRKGYIEYITCTINGVQDRWQYQEKIMSTNSLYLITIRKYLLLKCIEARYRVQMWQINSMLWL